MKTYYDTLEVQQGASQTVIKAAYKHLAQLWHPDKHPESPELANQTMAALTKAFDTLSDPVKRQEYDQTLRTQRQADQLLEREHQPEQMEMPFEESVPSPSPMSPPVTSPFWHSARYWTQKTLSMTAFLGLAYLLLGLFNRLLDIGLPVSSLDQATSLLWLSLSIGVLLGFLWLEDRWRSRLVFSPYAYIEWLSEGMLRSGICASLAGIALAYFQFGTLTQTLSFDIAMTYAFPVLSVHVFILLWLVISLRRDKRLFNPQ